MARSFGVFGYSYGPFMGNMWADHRLTHDMDDISMVSPQHHTLDNQNPVGA